MRLQRKRLVGIGAALAIAVAGGGAAIAASGHHGSTLTAGRFDGFRGGNPPGGSGLPGRGFGPGGDLQTAASYLGISVQTLLGNLRSGETLAQVADATSGKSSAGLVSALVAAAKSRIEQAVSAQRLTRAQADRLESGLQSRVQAQVTGSFGGRGGFGPPDGDDDHDHGFGPGGGVEPGSRGQAPAPTTTGPATHI